MKLVRSEVRDRVAVVTLDDPERRNAISLAMAEALVEIFADIGASREVGAVVVTGAPPAFSAGAALTDLAAADRDRLRRIYEGFLAVVVPAGGVTLGASWFHRGVRDALVPVWKGKPEPLCAVYSRACIGPIERTMDQGRVVSFYPLVRVRLVEEAAVRAVDPDGRSFANVNTPQDFTRIRGQWEQECARDPTGC